jgi:hypothetical protein
MFILQVLCSFFQNSEISDVYRQHEKMYTYRKWINQNRFTLILADEVKRMEKMMRWHFIGIQIAVLSLIALSVIGEGRAYAAEEELPCAEEIAKYCKEVKPGGGRILKCLDEHEKELSVSCKRKLEESKERLMKAQQACAGDMEKFCKDVQPGGGRILKCLREHTQELSPACRQEVEKTKGKVQEKQQTGKQGEWNVLRRNP